MMIKMKMNYLFFFAPFLSPVFFLSGLFLRHFCIIFAGVFFKSFFASFFVLLHLFLSCQARLWPNRTGYLGLDIFEADIFGLDILGRIFQTTGYFGQDIR